MSKKDQNGLDKNIKKAGVVIGRRQESKDIAYHDRLVTNKLRTTLRRSRSDLNFKMGT